MQVMETLSRLEARRVSLREESQAPQREIEQAMRSAGFATVEEFLAAAKRAEQWRQRCRISRAASGNRSSSVMT